MGKGEVASGGGGIAEGILQRSWRKEPRDRTDMAWDVPGR